MDRYRVLGRVGGGTHGLVLKAECRHTKRTVALKKRNISCPADRRGGGHAWSLPVSVLRELFSLLALQPDDVTPSSAAGDDDVSVTSHCDSHVVRLFDWFCHGRSLVLVMEFIPADLSQVIADRHCDLTPARVKRYMLWLLEALEFVHARHLLHRDIKPANLLIDSQGRLKLADFGLCRVHQTDRPLSHQAATRWYRAPELLYAARQYSGAVDVWSAGCVMAELLGRHWPLFRGQSDIDQLITVHRHLGTPTSSSWPRLRQLPDFDKLPMPEFPAADRPPLLPDASPQARHLLAGLLVQNPHRRLSASQALEHEYFSSSPAAAPLEMMPKPAPPGHRRFSQLPHTSAKLQQQPHQQPNKHYPCPGIPTGPDRYCCADIGGDLARRNAGDEVSPRERCTSATTADVLQVRRNTIKGVWSEMGQRCTALDSATKNRSSPRALQSVQSRHSGKVKLKPLKVAEQQACPDSPLALLNNHDIDTCYKHGYPSGTDPSNEKATGVDFSALCHFPGDFINSSEEAAEMPPLLSVQTNLAILANKLADLNTLV